MKLNPTDVVVALIWRGDTLLIGLRPEGKSFALKWEFPGGKCEPGEGHTEALQRECQEELGVEVCVGPRVWGPVHVAGPHGPLQLVFYHARLKKEDATPLPLTTLELQWVQPHALLQRPFCPADEALVQELAAGRIGGPQAF